MTLCSLHEAFKLLEDEEDSTVLRRVFIDFVLDGNESIQIQLNKTIGEIILRYANTDTVKNFKGRTPYIEPEPTQNHSGKNSKDTTPQSNKQDNRAMNDFSSAMLSVPGISGKPDSGANSKSKGKAPKKSTNVGIFMDNFDEEQATKLPPIYVT
jgi:hypothetical protein